MWAVRLQVVVELCEALDPLGVRAMLGSDLRVQAWMFRAWSHFLIDCLDLPRCEQVALSPSSHSSEPPLSLLSLPWQPVQSNPELRHIPPSLVACCTSLLHLLPVAASCILHPGSMQNPLCSDCSSPSCWGFASVNTALCLQYPFSLRTWSSCHSSWVN